VQVVGGSNPLAPTNYPDIVQELICTFSTTAQLDLGAFAGLLRELLQVVGPLTIQSLFS